MSTARTRKAAPAPAATVKAPVLQLVPHSPRASAVRSAETVQELEALLGMAHAGQLSGIAYVALRPGRQDAITGAAGAARQDQQSAVFWLQRLNLELLRLPTKA